MIRRAAMGVTAIAAVLAAYFFLGGLPMTEAELASKFYGDYSEELHQLISTVRQLPKGTRVESSEINVPESCPDKAQCKLMSLKAQIILRKANAPVLVVNEPCNGTSRCSVSIVFRRKGIAVSGSGTELIYDTAPAWGRFKIMPVPEAPKNWYYRHLGD